MGVPNVAFTWRSIKVLRAIVSTMSIIGLIVVFAAVVWAIRLKRDIGEYLNLVVPGDGHLWPTVIIVAAVPCAPVYLLGLKAYLCLRLANSNKKFHQDKNASDDEENSEDSFEESNDADDDDDNEKNNGQETNRLLFLHAILCLLSGCLVAAINVACFFKSSTFHDKINDDPLIEAMENYSNDDVARSRVDAIQLEFQCCGSEDYRDWFRVSWSKQSMEYFDYVGDEHQQEADNNEDRETRVEDVPFSCCTNKIIEPCGPHEILRASTVCNFDPSKEGTVWNVGCRSIIVTRAQVLGLLLIFLLLFLTVYQVTLCVLSRFLQTAYSNEFYIGPEMDHYRGWIFSSISSPCSKCHGNISQDSEEEILETRSPIKERSPSSTVCVNNKDNNRVDWKKKHEFVLTPRRGSVQLIEIDPLRKAKSNPVFYGNFNTNERLRKSKVKLDYYRALPTDEPYQERKQSDKKIFIDRSDKSIKASSRSRERLLNKKSDVVVAPVPPPFPPQSEYVEERNPVNEGFKIDETPSTKLRSAFVGNNESMEEKVNEETTSKPSKQDRRKLLEKFEKVLLTDQRRQSGGADFPRPWEQLVQRSIDITENPRAIDDNKTCQKLNEQSHVLSRFRSADTYDRFRGTLQDTLSRRRENPKEPTNPIRRSSPPLGTCSCCIKHNRNFGKPSRCKVQRTSPVYPVDPEDLGIVHRRSLLPDIPCPPPPPHHANPCTSACYYPRPTLIKQQQQEQRRQRQWNNRQQNLTNDQPPPWTLPISFSRPLTSNLHRNDDHRICCHGKTRCITHEGYSAFKGVDSTRKYRYRMD